MQLYTIISTLIVLLLTYEQTLAQHQHPGRTCHAQTVLEQQIQQDPQREQTLRDLETLTENYIRENGAGRNNQTRVIPVYIHVLYRTSNENISNAQIQSQIDVMNRDFGGQNADLAQVPSAFQSVTSTNSGIQFTIAGIYRKQTSKSSWGTNDAMKYTSQGGRAPITPNTHLNIWICNIGSGILGYAQFPGGSASTDGVVISPQFFGSSDFGNSFYLSAPFDKGRTAVHEVGHYLNLRHIWGDGGCSYDDYVNDTPLSSTANYGCPSYPTYHCNTSDMFMNYMDYVNDNCMFMFSNGQVARMWACLNTSRAQLGYSGSGNNTGGGNTCSNNEVTLELRLDNYPSETTWRLVNEAGQTVESGGNYSTAGSKVTKTLCLPDGCYDFIINDSYGDGICCSYGNGSYKLTDSDGNTIASGGSFRSTETKSFCFTPPPTCYDIQFNLNFDNYPSETSWKIKNSSGTTLFSGSGYTNSSSDISNIYCLDAGCYTFEIRDSYGDGICCSYGYGSYNIKSNTGATLISGGSFGSIQTKSFCVGGTTKVGPSEFEDLITPKYNIFPNPAYSEIHVESFQVATIPARMIDATGKVVWNGEIAQGDNIVNIQLLPTGIYYINLIHANGQITTKKFLKTLD